ncbi:flagellar biosynthesis anti-sigma factor FlgM [Chromobacterium violaceum]|uniref:flagellar biosynthesis anti-sigma factor FlgM n=1 Tax=Chromobacterium violaceum TaxID=536 RepID=UPI001E2D3D86|nr:flagellar biosynthesis anti-sigma factor FlgM [Chromobacterium violaceum]MCD0492715.1 flagellar biosynthesis anti-sigma factor FlgM [Chromobacterium violaceum]
MAPRGIGPRGFLRAWFKFGGLGSPCIGITPIQSVGRQMQISSLSTWRGEKAAGKTETAAATDAAPRAASPSAFAEAPLAASLRAMPEVDQSRVDEIRAALARGEVRFDAQRLAGLIEQYHGGR